MVVQHHKYCKNTILKGKETLFFQNTRTKKLTLAVLPIVYPINHPIKKLLIDFKSAVLHLHWIK